MNKTLKYLLIAAAVLIVFLIVAKKNGWIGKEDAIKVSSEIITRRTIIETVAANGKVQPEVEVKISPDVSGEVVELKVKEGDQVKKGQLLAKINPIIYASTVEQMLASLNSAKANLSNSKARLVQSQSQQERAEATYKRNKKLFDEGTISPSDWETAKSAYEVAKAEVDAAKESVSSADYNVRNSQASLKAATDNLAKTNILAPVDGTISKLSIEKGERVVGTSQMAGTEMMRIADLNEMQVMVDVNENDIVRVHLNDTASIEVDSYMEHKFKGIVTSMGNSANTVGGNADQVTNFPVKIRILRESYKDLIPKDAKNVSPFRPGMSATVDIQTRRAFNILAAPIQAVTTRDSSKKTAKNTEHKENLQEKEKENKDAAPLIECVFLVQKDKAVQKNVKTGVQDANYIEIIGLKQGDEVVSGPYSAVSKRLKNNSTIKVVPKDQLFNSEEK